MQTRRAKREDLVQRTALKSSGVDSREGWKVVIAITVILTFTSGVRLLPGVLLKPITEEFGWSRSELMLMLTVNMIFLSLLQPVLGFATDRFGAKRILVFGILLLGGILVPLSRATEVWQFYFYYGVLGALGLAAVSPVNITSVVSGWFDEQRGAALSIATSGAAFGQLMIVPIATLLLSTTDWRNLYLILAVILLIGMTPIALLLVKANDVEQRSPLTARHIPEAQRNSPSLGLSDALSSSSFWLLAFGFFVCGFTMAFATAHFLSYADDMGMSSTYAADVVAVTAIFSICGGFALGLTADRQDRRHVLAATYALRGTAFALLWLLPVGSWLFVYAIVLGISWTATTPLTAAISAELFGRANLGIIFGTMFSFMNVGFGAGSFLDGLVYDTFGNYRAALLANVVLGGLAAVAVLNVTGRGMFVTPPSGSGEPLHASVAD